MLGEECRGIGAASTFIGRTALLVAIRRMAQRCATAVRHPLASAASSTPPQLPLGGRNAEERRRDSPGGRNPGDKRRPSPAGERGNSDAASASLGGRNPRDERKPSPAGKRGNIDAAPASFEGQNPEEHIMDTARTMEAKRQRPISKGAVGTTWKSFSCGTKPWGQKKSFP